VPGRADSEGSACQLSDSRSARPVETHCAGPEASGRLGLTRASRAGGLGLFRGGRRAQPDSRGAGPAGSGCAGAGGGLGLTRVSRAGGLGLCRGGWRARPDSREPARRRARAVPGLGLFRGGRRAQPDSRGAGPAGSGCDGAGGGLGLTRASRRRARAVPGWVAGSA
jgi:hypothetical protein